MRVLRPSISTAHNFLVFVLRVVTRHFCSPQLGGVLSLLMILFLCAPWPRASAENQDLGGAQPFFRTATNDELVDLIARNAKFLIKPEPILFVVIDGQARKVDLDTWPGRLIAEKIRLAETECGVPMRPVSLDANYTMLIVLGVARSPIPTERERMSRVEAELQRLVRGTGRVARQSDPHGPWLHITALQDVTSNWRLVPTGFWKLVWDEFEPMVRELEGAVQSPTGFEERKAQLFKQLEPIKAGCPNRFWDRALRSAGLDAPPALLTQVMLDERIRPGANLQEVSDTARIVLRELRPNR
jgi:hypothetical protein